MKIHNVRMGFATNSSSDHSIVILPGAEDDRMAREGDFGWGYFTAASTEAKNNYLAWTIYENLRHKIGDSAAFLVVKSVLGTTGTVGTKDAYYCAVDHQSLLTIPNAYGKNYADMEFVEELKKFMLQKDLVILGGNDNDYEDEDLDDSEGQHPLLKKAEKVISLKKIRERTHEDLTCRKEPAGHWILFNKKSGAKITFSFSEEPIPDRSSTPELVDLKITDFCESNCPFCYQASSAKGKHANHSFDGLNRIIWELSDLKVFEVALGGGEPTSHPRFLDILEDIHRVGIVPNFSTRNPGWFKNSGNVRAFMDYCGGVAFSVSNANELEYAKAIVTVEGIPGDKVSYQVIPEVMSPWDFEKLLDICNASYVRITLLGYKKTGRGKKSLVNSEMTGERIFSMLKEHRKVPLGIDTTFAKRYQKQIDEMKVPNVLYRTEEGRHSMYIDAVRNMAGPSSYEPRKMVKFTDTKELKGIFQNFP